MPWSESFYRQLIKLYPRSFRRRYDDEMEQWFEQARAARPGNLASRVRFWIQILIDLIRSVPAEHLAAMARQRSGGNKPRKSSLWASLFETSAQDTRVAFRSYARTPGAFLVIVLTMAIAIGFVTTIFSAIEGVLLAPLPYPQSESLVRVGAGFTEESGRLYALSMPEAFHLQEQSRSLEAIGVARRFRAALRGEGEPELHSGAMVSHGFFEVLGVEPPLGRRFLAAEDEPGAEPVAILDHELWTRRFGADPRIIGQPIRLGSTLFTVVGVLPEGFHPPEAIGLRQAKVWITLSHLGEEMRNDPINHFLGGIARLRPELDPAAAQAELAALDGQFVERFPGAKTPHYGVASLHRETVGTIADALLPLFGAVSLLLLIACANVATLLLIRSGERAREMAVRGAIGAPRSRIVRQLLTESLWLGALGGGLGVLVAFAGVRIFVAYAPAEIPRISEIAVDGQVLLFALVTSLLTSLLFGLAPALQSSKLNLNGYLRAGLRAGAGGHRGAHREHLKYAFVVSEIAVAFMLVTGASLLIHSFLELHRVELGFDPENVHVLGASSPRGESPAENLAFYRQVMERLETLPGVVAVGATANLPMSGNFAMRSIEEIAGRPLPASDQDFDGGYSIYYQYVTPGFFDALSIARLRGRAFTHEDGSETPPVAILNEAAARDLFADEPAVGRRFKASDGYRETWFEVVGVVANIRHHRLAQEAGPELYLAHAQALDPPSLDFLARTDGPVTGTLPAMRAELNRLRADLPIRRTVYLRDFIADSAANPRFYSLALGSFAATALLLALVGIHGILAYSVSRRSREIGIRMAMGATDSSVLSLVLRKAALLAGLGLGLGLVGALLTTQVLESMLFGITPTDLSTLFFAVAAVAAAALITSLLPAWRATRLDPLTVLKES